MEEFTAFVISVKKQVPILPFTMNRSFWYSVQLIAFVHSSIYRAPAMSATHEGHKNE